MKREKQCGKSREKILCVCTSMNLYHFLHPLSIHPGHCPHTLHINTSFLFHFAVIRLSEWKGIDEACLSSGAYVAQRMRYTAIDIDTVQARSYVSNPFLGVRHLDLLHLSGLHFSI